MISMNFVGWALLAMITYGTATFMLKVVFKTMHPSFGLTVANIFVVAAGVGWIWLSGSSAFRNVGWNSTMALLLAAGVVLAVAITSLYRSLSLGPASAVAPIFALAFTVSAVLGFIILGEPVKATRIVGIVLAIAAIILISR